MTGTNFVKLLYFFSLLFFIPHLTAAQSTTKRDAYLEYIDNWASVAVSQMAQYRIPASITLSQGLIESGAGKSDLAVKANNHFGIKCHDGWDGATFKQDDDAPGECFRKYKNAEESFKDHSLFLTQRSRYADLFKLDIYDYKAWAYGLKKAGYATNPRYGEMLIKVIEDYELFKYDRLKGNLPVREHKIHQPLPVKANGKYFNGGYQQPGVENFTFVEEDKNGRKIYMNNSILIVFAGKGESFQSIAESMKMSPGRLARFNEMKKKEALVEGQIIYIERKKLNGIRESYTVQPHDSWYSIAQMTGVQLSALKELNSMAGDSLPKPGSVLSLKGYVKRTFFQKLFGGSKY